MVEPLAEPLFSARERRLAALDALPIRLWKSGLTHSAGTLEPRLTALRELREALVAGSLDEQHRWAWPPPAIARPVAQAMEDLGLPRYCEAQQELTDTVLAGLMFHLDFIVDYIDRGTDEANAIRFAVDAFSADWQERCGEMNQLVEVFGDLGDTPASSQWDTLRGLLRSGAWQEVLRIRQLIEKLPELAAIIRRLGRSQLSDDPDQHGLHTEVHEAPADALVPYSRKVHVPDLPGETRGVCRSDRIARMLPAEALLLGHPQLRLVWHARRAERSLLAYEDDDLMEETRQRSAKVRRPVPRRRPDRRLEMGPLMVCVDTSASMQGGAEAVAKAVVLEAVRCAHAQKRACKLICFGGDGEVLETDIAVDAAGIGLLTDFLGRAFGGGTDICGPLTHCLDRLDETRWRLADLLIASDGEFGATAELAERLRGAKAELGLRVQGVLVGDRETIGFLEVADALHWVRDWRRFGGSDVDSPVHDKNLTSTYFPGALRNADTLAATVSPKEASAAVRRGDRYIPLEERGRKN